MIVIIIGLWMFTTLVAYEQGKTDGRNEYEDD